MVIGLGKAKEVTSAIAKGIDDAKKAPYQGSGAKRHIATSSNQENTVEQEYIIKPAAPGTGVIAGGAMRAVLESVGVKDVLAKSKGSSNPHSVVKATINALSKMRDPYTVAQVRGVELDTVFNG